MKHLSSELAYRRGHVPLPVVGSGHATYSVVSMFSGCGGLDLGFLGGFSYNGEEYEKLPFSIARAYDNELACSLTYKANIGPHFELTDLAIADAKIMPAADILIGGFPCQEFSICGPKGGTGSERGALYKAMVRYAAYHRPKMVVAENVAHLPRLNNGKDFSRIKAAFSRAGYVCHLWNIAAQDYGVPQARQRIILVFARKDLNIIPKMPSPSHEKSPRTAEWAIGDLLDVVDDSVANQDQYFKAGLAKSGNGQGDEVTKRDAPGYTVRANAKSRVQFHYELSRRLTVRECARLQTFPDTFVFPHAATTNVRQIGNAVPPVLGHVVARAILEALDPKRDVGDFSEVRR